ncbi:hypothetical protein Pla163_31520 [Planctomycetes bacterium Pla163]|uniref:Glycosyltransferase RgtA/B/C/D-like domain-containing protein n=1 Tax=Rohdeia mirabilis TaxID=2528008 RepID=A0A518D3H2_9BACT|nr:hypothetical protein Pla163_31520 [Planctomycetes bacterium Pla163]
MDAISSAGATSTRARLAAVGLALAAALLLAAVAPDVGPWGDGLGILAALADTSGADPRVYHLGYALFARLALTVADAVGMAHEPALIHMSRAALAAGAATTVWVATGLRARPSVALGWVVVALASPSLWFFSGVVEVHAVQFLGSAVALLLAVRAHRSTSDVRRYLLVLAAAGVALILHLSHLLLLPGLFLLALPTDGNGAVGRRRLVIGGAGLVVLGVAVALGCFAYFRGLEPSAPVPGGLLRPVYYLGLYEHTFLHFKSIFGWFGPTDVLRFLAAEGLGQGGFLWLAGALACVTTRGRLRQALVAVAVVYVLVVSQAGLRERGGYFVSLAPWFVVGAAAAATNGGRALRLAPWLVLPLQLALGWNDLADHARRPDARTWSRAVLAVVEQPCTVFTADMVRLSALPLASDGLDGLQWSQQFEFTPRSRWDATLKADYEAALVTALGSGAVYLDADILGAGSALHERAAWQRWATDLFERPDVVLLPIAAPPGPPFERLGGGGVPLLFELRPAQR